MLENLPSPIIITCIASALLTLLFLYLAIVKSNIENAKKKANIIVLLNVLWLILQAILTYNGYYKETHSFPPRFILAVLPPLLLILALFITYEGRLFMDHMSLEYLTYLNIVRIPVELMLYWLFLYKAIPQLMTFEGRNWDILAGLTAPFIAFFGFTIQKISKKSVLVWNYLSLALLLNIIINAMLSVPFPFQQFAFDQPNIAVLYFPFSWVPSFIVPTVLFTHLVSIRQLTRKNNGSKHLTSVS